MLTVSNLTVHYGRIVAVHRVSLEVKEGEVVGVIGPNGAGKSTTLHAIVGAVPPTAGDIQFLDQSVAGQAPEKIARRGISLVPEGRHIFAKLTVEENLKLGTTARRGGERAAAIEHMLERFPALKTYFRSSAGKLSGGEQQQLAIARALLSNPKLLLLDEPSLGLAPIMVDRVFEILAQLHAEGVTILLVEQNTVRTLEIADRVYVMRSGRVEAAGTPRELRDEVDLESIYLGLRVGATTT